MIRDQSDPIEARLRQFLLPEITRSANRQGSAWLSSSIGSRQQNQDRVACLTVYDSASPARSFCAAVLSDGMGGMAKGDIAANITISAFLAHLLRNQSPHLEGRLWDACLYANAAVYRELRASGGATISALVWDTLGKHFALNVGDSRVYGVLQNKELVQISTDDTLGGVLGARAQGGRGVNDLVQFIGMEEEGLEPHIFHIDKQSFEHILLTSDGLHGSEPEAVKKIVARSASIDRDLLGKLTTLSNLLGGRDNASGIAVRLERFDLDEAFDGQRILVSTAMDSMEIWFPRVEQSVRQQSSVSAETRREAPKAQAMPPAKTKSTKRRKQTKKKVEEADDQPLPLIPQDKPVLNVQFPRDDEDR